LPAVAADRDTLEATDFHPGRSGRDHLRMLGQAVDVPDSRADEVLRLVELGDTAHRRVKGYSLGMRQRLGLAAALLGDPELLILDEPANGLDPEGILWIRQIMHALADEGRTVFVSSHLLSEMAQTAQDLVVIGKGRLMYQGTTEDFITRATRRTVKVRSPHLPALREALALRNAAFSEQGDTLVVSQLDSDAIGMPS